MDQPTRKDSFLNATLLGIALLLIVQAVLDGGPAGAETARATPAAVSAAR